MSLGRSSEVPTLDAGPAPRPLTHPGAVLLRPDAVVDWPVAGWCHEPPGLADWVIATAPTPGAARPDEAWLWHANYALMTSAATAAVSPDGAGRFTALTAALLGSHTLDLAPGTPVPAQFVVVRTLAALVTGAGLAFRTPAARAKFLGAHGAAIGDLVERQVGRLPPAGPADPLSRRNNHSLQRGLVLAAWGAFTGDAAAFELGLGAYRATLPTIGADGHLANEALRGASAAWYSNLAVMLMTTIAHIAAVQGVDLVRETVAGRGLDEAVGFVLAAIDNPALLHRHAARNLYPHPQHGTDPFATDLGFVDGYHRSRHYLAWVPVYASLAPDSRHLPALTALYRRHTAYFPPVIEYAGGQVFAFVRPIAPW
ncbi:alginate lyase family protein [Methylobrevis albus]|uniref:Alginate lyase family protein n=1 Tax=Methylobrevis albus TaxID=2793297 RepID=A0A931I239_9HYPH|nr:alginate lyase family protein [Methylobrevis albus]MBH0237516.1 alginate lyase family protein [Methylobrevis albus]